MSDRGAERRRLLDAVRSEEPESSADREGDDPSEVRPEPAPDGGAVTLDAPLYHCVSCGRTYLEEPLDCAGCGGSAFERRTAE